MVLPIFRYNPQTPQYGAALGLYKIIRKNLQLRRRKDIKLRFE